MGLAMRNKNNYQDQIQDLYSYAKEAKKLSRNVTLQVTDSCDMACSYCTAGDTLIRMADGTDKPIRDIVIGDRVLGFEENANSSKIDTFESEVIATYHRSARVSGIEFSGGSHLNITTNHEVLSDIMSPIDSAFVPSGMLRVGDRVFSLVGDCLTASESVTDVCDYLMPIDVFNIGTTSRTYIANGIAVHNCYQTHKGNARMTRETAKRIIDMLFDMWERDDPNEYIDKSTKAIVLDFIGGEPLLNIDIIDYACDYFWHRALELRCPWADTWRASMISNGTQYFNPKVQNFIRKYADKLSFGITIDGDKEMHDSCRKHHDGRGNFEEAHAAQKHFHETYASVLSTKVTIAPENLDKLHSIVKYFIDNGYSQINANTVYEAEWTLEQAQVYYSQLKQISDYLIDNDIDVPVSLFSEWAFKPLPESENQNWCGSSGKMLSFDPDGKAFPCIRFMESSLNGSQKPMCVGDCVHGIYKTDEDKSTLEMLESMTRRSQSNDECFYCHIAAGCAWCNGWQYQKFGTPNKRDTASCIMHKARSLANVYYWNKKYRKEQSDKRFNMYLPKEDAIEIIGIDEYNLLSKLESHPQE